MATRDVVVIGASAGGIEAICQVLSTLPADYPGVIGIVMHIAPQGGRALASVFGRCGPLPVHAAVDNTPLVAGNVYVAPADHRLLLGDGVVLVRGGPKENGHRPAVDPLFRSAARHFGPRAIGVVLSGTLNDGTSGTAAIRRNGGIGVVQDPANAAFGDMPAHALEEAGADFVAPADEIGPLLARFAHEQVVDTAAPAATLQQEVALMESDDRVTATTVRRRLHYNEGQDGRDEHPSSTRTQH